MSIPTLFEYLPYKAAVAITKIAEKKEPTMTGTVAKGLLGFGGGMLAGGAAAEAARRIYKATQGKPIPRDFLVPAAGLVGGGFGLAYSLYKAKEQEELRRAFEAKRNRTQGSVSGK